MTERVYGRVPACLSAGNHANDEVVGYLLHAVPVNVGKQHQINETRILVLINSIFELFHLLFYEVIYKRAEPIPVLERYLHHFRKLPFPKEHPAQQRLPRRVHRSFQSFKRGLRFFDDSAVILHDEHLRRLVLDIFAEEEYGHQLFKNDVDFGA